MNIRFIHIDEDGYYSTLSFHNKEVWFKPDDELDLTHFTHFEIEHTHWGDYTGNTVTRSNQRVLIELLDEEQVPYIHKVWAYWTHSIYIPVAYLDHPVISEIIDAIDSYPALNDEDWSNLEWELTEEYFQDIGNRWDFKLEDPDGKTDDDIFQDYMEAYHHMCESGNGEGIIFETGCIPYLHEDKIKVMREYLINQLNYQSEV